jgi:hypothetical protein
MVIYRAENVNRKRLWIRFECRTVILGLAFDLVARVSVPGIDVL